MIKFDKNKVHIKIEYFFLLFALAFATLLIFIELIRCPQENYEFDILDGNSVLFNKIITI
ncbi:hypothetical protein [Clostridium akagii]|uniref:hypothetical protein n=1 Tax=Clostridium akagii TaxID=91623 RepID=UPI00047C1C11|nr:hypothetical protein [Clostridium akagii]